MVMACTSWAKGRGEILRKAENRSFEAMMNNPTDIARITRWIQQEGRLEQFRLTLEVEAKMSEREVSKENWSLATNKGVDGIRTG